jgi:NDP-sugar pyrophosphorylase family protein
VHAMILAAGEGLRLRPLTETVPKALVAVAGRPLIEYAIETLARSGIEDIVVNLYHLGDRIREHLGDGRRFGVRLSYSVETTLLGSGGGIRHARRLFGDGTFITLNADTIIEIEIEPLLRFHRENRAAATMVLRKDPHMAQYGLIHLDGGSRVARFLKHDRPDAPDRLEPYMFTGVQVLEPVVFDYMPWKGAFSITEVTYPSMLKAGEPIFGYPFEGRWLTVGTPEELARAEQMLS